MLRAFSAFRLLGKETVQLLIDDSFGSLSIRTDEAVQNQIWVRMNLILAQIFCYFTLIN